MLRNDKNILFSTIILWAKNNAFIAIVMIKNVLFKRLAYMLHEMYPNYYETMWIVFFKVLHMQLEVL